MDLPTQLALRAARVIREGAWKQGKRMSRGVSIVEATCGISLDVEGIAAIIDKETRLPQWKAALEGLTPSGSEFVDDPERCAAFVRDRLDANHRMLMDALRKLRELADERAGQ
jgi:hypothetical protein